MREVTILQGHVLDILRGMPDESVHCGVTSPPYWGLRDYGLEPQVWGGDKGCQHEWIVSSTCSACGAWRGSLGLEPTLSLYIEHLVEVCREFRRVLRSDGTFWVNLGDSYASAGGHADSACNERRGAFNIGRRPEHESRPFRQRGHLKRKDLCMVPHRFAIAAQEDGWYVRADIVWSKPNPMPESVRDRPSKAHEYVFLLTKSPAYFYDADAVREPVSTYTLSVPWRGRSTERSGIGFPSLADRRRRLTKAEALKGPHGTTGFDGNGMRMPDKWSNPSGRNQRSVWTIATSPFPEAHFATFPPKIPERCIKAGTSEHGCCTTCGTPWKRIAEATYKRSPRHGSGSNMGRKAPSGQNGIDGSGMPRVSKVVRTIGWQPTCCCDPQGDLAPATVLDPFGGSGTVGMVAARLGRRAILIDLKPEYCEMAEKRIRKDAPLLNQVERSEV